VIAGGAGGGALLLLLCGYLYVRNKSEKDDMNDFDQTKATTLSGQRIAAEILVEPQDEVSTLGDPMFAPGGMLIGSLEKDEVTASVGDDYDYARQYRNERNPASLAGDRSRLMSEDYTKSSSVNSATMMSKLGRMGESLFADDASFEQQFAQPEERFDVVAPAGKLGMVIDTPNGGFPVVHAIKDTSVLSDRVRVGDRLLSVDGDDCTAMTAMQVSKLISLKSEKPARVLVFARSNATPTS
jgi:C-terminal processing protease CtpA/Prc